MDSSSWKRQRFLLKTHREKQYSFQILLFYLTEDNFRPLRCNVISLQFQAIQYKIICYSNNRYRRSANTRFNRLGTTIMFTIFSLDAFISQSLVLLLICVSYYFAYMLYALILGMQVCQYNGTHMWRSEINFQELVPSFHHEIWRMKLR